MQSKDEYKIIIIGDCCVGKTTFLSRFLKKEDYDNANSTIGVASEKADITVKTGIADEGLNVPLRIWDTAGQERYKSIVDAFYRNSDGVIIMYDARNRSTLENAMWWVKEVKKHCSSVPICLVGNKCEDQTKVIVSENEAKEFARSCGLESFRSSAYDNINVMEVFEYIASCMVKKDRRRIEDSVSLTPAPSSRMCC